MSAPAKIKVKLWSERLDNKIKEMQKLTGRSRVDIVKSSMDHFLRAAGKATPIAKQKKRNIERSDNKRDWVLFASAGSRIKPKNTVGEAGRKNKFKAFFFRKKSEAQRYAKIKYRGISKAGWWYSLFSLRYNTASPRGYKTEVGNAARNYSFFEMRSNIVGKAMAIAINQIAGITRYGEVAKNIALRSTAKWMNANVNRIKKEMQAKFNA